MNNRYRNLLSGVLACAISAAPIAAFAGPYTGLIVFGDSLADAGNNAIVFDQSGLPLPPGTLRTPVPIPSPGFVPPFFPYSSGRYSNGPVWVEQLASSLGLSAAPSLAGGANFAFGGATTGPSGSSFPFSLRDQVSTYLGGTGGSAPSGNLYVVVGGGNDAREAFARAAGGGNPAPLVAAYASNIGAILAQLEAGGADHILLADVPDIGKLPEEQALGPQAAVLATAIATAFNNVLSITLAQLRVAIPDDIQLLDLFGLQNQLFSDPTSLGFSDATSTCAFSAACIADPAGVFYWDGIHPTTSGHAAIARTALALVQVPLPGTALLLMLGLVILAISRRATAPKLPTATV